MSVELNTTLLSEIFGINFRSWLFKDF